MSWSSTQVVLTRRPRGVVDASNFHLREVVIPEPREGEVVVRNLVMSLDPYMRPRMDDVESYIPPFVVGDVLEGGAIGEVVASGDPRFAVGDVVSHMAGWRDYSLIRSAAGARIQLLDLGGLPPSYFLGVLGMPGLTAYAGLVGVAKLQPAETIYVSSAAGAVGGLVGQFSSLLGAGRVIGSAGSASKVEYVRDVLGFDDAFNYRDGLVAESLGRLVPDGLHVYFDNVGGDHFAAALESMKDFGRIVMCGTVSSYNDEARDRVIGGDLFNIVKKRLRISGLHVNDHADRNADFQQTVGGWLRSGDLVVQETVHEGIESAPEGFVGMLAGSGQGKTLVNLADPSTTPARPGASVAQAATREG